MNAKDLARDIATRNGLADKQVRQVLEELFEGIVAAVATGEEVSIPRFGKFKRKSMPARQGRNPGTGEAIPIAASNKVTFAPAKALKDRL